MSEQFFYMGQLKSIFWFRSKDAPLIFIPEKGGKQCRPKQSVSSIGFLALVTSIVNAVISASNNINNNNNNRNNNNNDLNDNNNNVQVGNLGSMQMNVCFILLSVLTSCECTLYLLDSISMFV